ncbi:class I SAM-dependent methyltransferase, partial [Ideonella sp.]|uniref:class I SAM-dependent methyltransferase n=1 Tax=Ideonella sp. TaxID=1929293 RepID=UPI003BB55281
YWAAHFARDDPRAGARKAREAFEAKLAANPALYGPVRVGTLGSGPRFADLNPTGGADRVLTFRNVHNWLAAGHLDATLQACFAALKPGGVLGVVEHRAAPGTPIERMKDSGYIPEAFMIERAQAAGFELAERSEVNANPRDTRDHAKGVWALPPTLAGGEVAREKYLAIGESDRFTHRYRKPG